MIRNVFVLMMLLLVDSGVNLKMLKEKPNLQFQSDKQLDHPKKRDLTSSLSAFLALLLGLLDSFIEFGASIIESFTPSRPGAICPCNQTNNHTTSDVQTRIVGGSPTEPHEYPQMGQLKCDVIIVDTFCGCTLINPSYCVTAAHCVTSRNANVTKCNVTLGTRYSILSNQSEPTAQTIAVTKIIVAKEYDPVTNANDIAIVKLSRPVQFSQNIQPACIPLKKENYYNDSIIAVGFGKTSENGSLSDVLRDVYIHVIPNEECAKQYQTTIPVYPITDKQICAGEAEGGKDTCSGDSGGPIFLNTTKPLVLVGATSYGNGCAEPNYAGVYTKVGAYAAFILKYATVEDGCQVYSDDMLPPPPQ